VTDPDKVQNQGLTPTVRELLHETAGQLAAAGVEGARAVAEWLLAAVLDLPRLELFTRLDRVVTTDQAARFCGYAQRAARHEPLQYILGETAFMHLTIRCDRRALIPRPETELLADLMRQDIETTAMPSPVLVDVGTGTGAIALFLADRFPTASVQAVDRSPNALALARENAQCLGLAQRIDFQLGDLLASFSPATADFVAGNLPYIPSADCDALEPVVRDYEPRLALDGGPHGLDLINRLIPQARSVLRPGGRLYLEIGADQGPAARDALIAAGFSSVTIKTDTHERDRIACATQSGSTQGITRSA
jgi:release factor glutamine methyltransferase